MFFASVRQHTYKEHNPHGTLVVPEDAEIQSIQLAVERKLVAGSRFTYSKSLVLQVDRWTKFLSENDIKIAKSPYDTTFTCTLTKDIDVLIRNIGKRTPEVGFYVPTKEQMNDELPESGHGIDLLATGILNSGKLIISGEKYIPFAEDIFTSKPCLLDIKQYQFGDCFLLSVLQSILQQPHGADFIEGMMKQRGDHTIVRLFSPTTGEPVYIRIPNCYYSINGYSYDQHHLRCYHIIEQAYAMYAQLSNGERGFPSFRHIYGKGGLPKLAMKIITGCDAQHHSAQPFRGTVLQHIEKILDDAGLLTLLDVIPEEPGETKTAILASVRRMFDEYAHDSVSNYNKDHLDTLFNQLLAFHRELKIFTDDTKVSFGEVIHTEDMQRQLCKLANLLQGDYGLLFTNIFLAQSRSMVDDNTQLGRYNDYHDKIFNTLLQAVRTGKLATASTANYSASIKRFGGVYAGHAYAILDVWEGEADNTKGVKFIRIANPWGKKSPKMPWNNQVEQVEQKLEETEEPISDIELTYFCRLFSTYTISKTNLPIASKDKAPSPQDNTTVKAYILKKLVEYKMALLEGEISTETPMIDRLIDSLTKKPDCTDTSISELCEENQINLEMPVRLTEILTTPFARINLILALQDWVNILDDTKKIQDDDTKFKIAVMRIFIDMLSRDKLNTISDNISHFVNCFPMMDSEYCPYLWSILNNAVKITNTNSRLIDVPVVRMSS